MYNNNYTILQLWEERIFIIIFLNLFAKFSTMYKEGFVLNKNASNINTLFFTTIPLKQEKIA